jgi:hypothetical protein
MSAPRRNTLTLALQLLGFAAGVGLMVWAGSFVFSDANVEARQRIWSAPAHLVALLLGLSVLTHLINGSLFYAALAPVRRLRFWEVQAVNAMASLLASLPFKLSVLLRVAVHHRRDGVPLLTIGAWFIAVGVVMLASAAPVIIVSLARPTVDALWFVLVIVGVALSAGTVVAAAGFFSEGRGWALVERVWNALPLPGALRGEPDPAEGRRRPTLLDRGHEGLRMLAHPGAVFASAGLRLADAGVHAGRFLVAAAILGVPLAADHAVLAGSSYYLIGALAPTGALGAREGGTGLIGQILAEVDLGQFMLIVVVVTAADLLVLLVGGAVGLAFLRPDRLFGRSATAKAG